MWGGGGVLSGYGCILMCTVVVSDCAYYNTKSIIIIEERGRVSYSVYCCANALRIIKRVYPCKL